MHRSLIFASLAVASLASLVSGQQVQRNVISINPFGVLFGYYSGEFERTLSPSYSWALSASYMSLDDDNFLDLTITRRSTIDGKVRYYPSKAAPSRFSFGASVGYFHQSYSERIFEDLNAISLGLDIGYNWLLGRERHFFIGTGIGAKRFIPWEGGDDLESLVYPSLRLSIGYAF